MSTDLTPTPEVPAEPVAPEVPRDDAGRFAPAPPTVEAPAGPQPPTTAAPDQSAEALAFYQQHQRAETQQEAFMRLAAERGFIPSGADLTPDELRYAAQEMWAYKQQQMGQQPQVPMPGQPQPGYYGAGTAGAPLGPQPFDPEQFAETIEQRVMSAWEQRDQQAQEQRMQQERISHLHEAVGSVGANLAPAQQQMLLQNVALGIDTAIERGQQIDFSRRQDGSSAIQDYAAEVLAAMQGMASTQNTVETQQAIAEHRGMAPRTVTPSGSPQAGAPGAPRGLQGAAAQLKQAIAAEQQGG